MGFYLRIYVLVSAILSCEATRFYYLAHSEEQPSTSTESRYTTSYTQDDAPALLTPRTDLNKHLDLHPKKAPIANTRCSMFDVRYVAGIENPTGRVDGFSIPYGLHCDTLYNSLLCLHCLLTV